jgi:hypothetical protein
MPATSTRIGFITQSHRAVVAGPDSGVVTKYGDLARDTGDDALETFFDGVADAQAMVDARLVLLKADRRRFKVEVQGEGTGLAFDYSQVSPTVTTTDDERAFSAATIVSEIAIDFEKEKTILGVWG